MTKVNRLFSRTEDFIKEFIFFSLADSEDNKLIHNSMFIYTYCIYEQLISQLETQLVDDNHFHDKIAKILEILKTKNINSLKRRGHLDTLKVVSLILREDINYRNIDFEKGFLHIVEYSEHGKKKIKSLNFYDPDNNFFKEVLLLHSEIRERRNCIAHRGIIADENYKKILKPIQNLVIKHQDVFNIDLDNPENNIQITDSYIRHTIMNIIKIIFIFYDLAYSGYEDQSDSVEELLSIIIGEALYIQTNSVSSHFYNNIDIDLYNYFKTKHSIKKINNPKLLVNILLSFKKEKNDSLRSQYKNEITALENKLELSNYGKFANSIFDIRITNSIIHLKNLLNNGNLSKSNIFNDYLFRYICFKSEFTDFYYDYFNEEFDINKIKKIFST